MNTTFFAIEHIKYMCNYFVYLLLYWQFNAPYCVFTYTMPVVECEINISVVLVLSMFCWFSFMLCKEYSHSYGIVWMNYLSSKYFVSFYY